MTPARLAPARAGRPPSVPAVLTSVPEGLSDEVDWSAWYLTDEEDEGERPEQGDIIRLFISILDELLRGRGRSGDFYVGGDAFFAWNPDEPLVRVSPDVYLLREPVPRPLPHSWQTWLSGHCPPEVAFEIVSDDWKKDYELGPAKYALLGVGELLIFDPGVVQGTATGEERFALQLYRRTEDGLFVLRYAGDGPVHSRVLECHVVALQTPGGPRLRLAADPEGRELQPSVAEAREAAKRDREAAIREREAAERKAEALQMELDRLREKEESR